MAMNYQIYSVFVLPLLFLEGLNLRTGDFSFILFAGDVTDSYSSFIQGSVLNFVKLVSLKLTDFFDGDRFNNTRALFLFVGSVFSHF